MDDPARRITKPRCFLIYALAPESLSPAEANGAFNRFVGDPALPLPIFHDHFIGRPGGVAIFFVENPSQRDALLDQASLQGWNVEVRPLIYSTGPSAFDEQVAFTLRAYRGIDWERLQREERPSYGDPAREAETAQES